MTAEPAAAICYEWIVTHTESTRWIRGARYGSARCALQSALCSRLPASNELLAVVPYCGSNRQKDNRIRPVLFYIYIILFTLLAFLFAAPLGAGWRRRRPHSRSRELWMDSWIGIPRRRNISGPSILQMKIEEEWGESGDEVGRFLVRGLQIVRWAAVA